MNCYCRLWSTFTLCPVNQTALADARPVVQQPIYNDENISTIDLFGIVESSLGAQTPANSIVKIKYQLKQSLNSFGKSLDSLTREYMNRLESGGFSYIISITDERAQDFGTPRYRSNCSQCNSLQSRFA